MYPALCKRCVYKNSQHYEIGSGKACPSLAKLIEQYMTLPKGSYSHDSFWLCFAKHAFPVWNRTYQYEILRKENSDPFLYRVRMNRLETESAIKNIQTATHCKVSRRRYQRQAQRWRRATQIEGTLNSLLS